MRSAQDGIYTEPQSKRGQALFNEHCAGCHAESLKGDTGPALVGDEFLFGWKTLTVGDLLETISVTMPKDNLGGLSVQQSADVLAYVLSANKFPAGPTELAPTIEALREVPLRPETGK